MRNIGLLKLLMIFCFLGLVSVSCDKDDDDDKVDLDAVRNYKVTFVGHWFEEDYDNGLPVNASFSSFVGLTHKSPNSLFKLGRNASEGLASYCKSGDETQLVEEINSLLDEGRSSVCLQAGSLEPEGEISIEFETTLRHKYLSFVGKISPSPDWFVSIENLDLSLVEAGYVLFQVNDAGVVSGESFNSVGQDTEDPISRISSGDLSVGGIVPTIGYIVIQRIYPESE